MRDKSADLICLPACDPIAAQRKQAYQPKTELSVASFSRELVSNVCTDNRINFSVSYPNPTV